MQPQELQIFWKNFLAATEVEGTMGNITFYKMWGRYYARAKSSLTGKRVKRDKKFWRTMQQAFILGLASEYITPVYYRLTEDWRCHDVFRKLTGIAIRLLRQGKGKKEIQEAAYAEMVALGYREEWPVWEFPPNLKQWLEGDKAGSMTANRGRIWVVNDKGRLAFTRLVSNKYAYPSSAVSSTAAGFDYTDTEMAMPP